jgi:hypothetical protein
MTISRPDEAANGQNAQFYRLKPLAPTVNITYIDSETVTYRYLV